MLKYWKRAGNPLAPVGDPRFPYVMTTYRLTEHHLSGVDEPLAPWLAELQPELFVEISPELAAEKGIGNLDWVRVSTPRGADPGQGAGHAAPAPVHDRRQDGPPRRACPGTGATRGVVTGDVVNDLTALVGDPERVDPRGQGVRLQRGEGDDDRADGLLHRHDGLHRLQGLRGRLQGVEPASRRPTAGANTLSGDSYDNTRRLDGDHWRHVKFIEQFSADRERRPLADDERRLQALRPGRLPRGLPDRRDHPHRVRHRGHPGRHLQRLPRLHRRLPVRRHRHQPGVATPRRSARSATTGCRSGWSRPAPRPARRTRSSSARSRSCEAAAEPRVRQLHEPGESRAYLYGADEKMLGGLNSFYLLVDKPEVYGLPREPEDALAQPRAQLAPLGGGRGGRSRLLGLLGLRKRRMDGHARTEREGPRCLTPSSPRRRTGAG